MKILVTGGCGFIGCNFIRHMVGKGAEIVNLNKPTYASVRSNLRDIEGRPGYSFIEGDVCSREDVENAMKGCEQVVHFAAGSHVDRSIEDAGPFVRTNVVGTGVMLDAARKLDVKKFVFISTDEVYGQIREGSFRESDPLRPRNPYSATKAGADMLAYSYFVTHGLPVVITRSSNNFGPYQYPEKVIPLFITNLLRGRKVPLYGGGENVRDWIYVMDNVEAIEACLERGRNGEAYNIGGGNELSNLELTRHILKELGSGEDMIEYVRDRPGHDLRYSLDSGKISRDLGWKPKRDFQTALKETVRWYRENEWWWKPLIK